MTLTRRELLRLAAAAAASPMLPAGAVAAAPAAAPVKAGRFFTSVEMAVLGELCEAIIPADEHSGGAIAAGVPAYIDARLAAYDASIPESQADREAWRAGLAPFLGAAAADRPGMLERLAAGEGDPRTDGEHFFKTLKAWTARGYYTSSLGIHEEMEYKGNTLLTEFEGVDPASLPPPPKP